MYTGALPVVDAALWAGREYVIYAPTLGGGSCIRKAPVYLGMRATVCECIGNAVLFLPLIAI